MQNLNVNKKHDSRFVGEAPAYISNRLNFRGHRPNIEDWQRQC